MHAFNRRIQIICNVAKVHNAEIEFLQFSNCDKSKSLYSVPCTGKYTRTCSTVSSRNCLTQLLTQTIFNHGGTMKLLQSRDVLTQCATVVGDVERQDVAVRQTTRKLNDHSRDGRVILQPYTMYLYHRWITHIYSTQWNGKHLIPFYSCRFHNFIKTSIELNL